MPHPLVFLEVLHRLEKDLNRSSTLRKASNTIKWLVLSIHELDDVEIGFEYICEVDLAFEGCDFDRAIWQTSNGIFL